jgi:nicotinamidase-related amidase
MPHDESECQTALLVIDLINRFDFPRGELLFRRALPAARAIAALRARARDAGVPAIYVNDSFDADARDLREFIAQQQQAEGPAREIVSALQTDPDHDLFVAKPMHSGFFGTGLDAVLRKLRVDHLILTGVAADICVLATAFDAHLRGFELSVPCDCVAAESAEAELWALRQMARVLGADVQASPALTFQALGPADHGDPA